MNNVWRLTMNIKNVTRDFGNSLENVYHVWVSRVKKFRYFRELLFCLLIGVAVTAVFFGYQWYSHNRDRIAQVELSTLIDHYHAVITGKKNDGSQLITTLNEAYDSYASTSYAPYFLLFQVNLLLHDDKKDQALPVLEKALILLKNSPLIDLFATKYALMLLDEPGQAEQDKGLKELIALAHNTQNNYRDYALYYLGRYYFLNNKNNDAKIVWQELIDSQSIEQVSPSPWAQLAQQKIDQII